MAVTQQIPIPLISNLQFYPTHFLQQAVALSLRCARATNPGGPRPPAKNNLQPRDALRV